MAARPLASHSDIEAIEAAGFGAYQPYETVLEGTTVGYFMHMQKLPREKAVVAAKEHLKKMPAWAGRG